MCSKLNPIVILNNFLAFWILQSNGETLMGIGNLKLNKLEMCDPSYDYPLAYEFSFKKAENGDQLISAKAHFKTNFGENSDYNITVLMKKDKDDAEYSRLVSLYGEDTCESMKKYLGVFIFEMQKAAGLEPGTCPVPKGEYVLNDFKMDFSKIPYQSIPEGFMRIEHTVKDVKTKEVLMCLLAEGENFKN